MIFASRKSRIGAPLSHRRTEEIGACLADPSANGEGARMKDTFTIPEGRRRRVYRPSCKLAQPHMRCQPAAAIAILDIDDGVAIDENIIHS
jgi:hypothetical protein